MKKVEFEKVKQLLRLKNILSYLVVVLIFLVQVASAGDYLIGSGDILRITVYDHEDLENKVRVDSNGDINMPLIGSIGVSNLTIQKVSKKITNLLADGYIVNPQVNVFVEEYRSKKVVILGHVNKPGLIELSGSTSLLELISQAGGLAKDAGDTATIKRKTAKDEKIINIDLISLVERGDLSQNIFIRDGDTVYITKAGMCFTTGEVKKPGTYPCGEGSTVLKLIALSSGFTGKAAKSSVRIVRVIDGKKKVFKNVNLDTPVKHNDVIVVPESFF